MNVKKAEEHLFDDIKSELNDIKDTANNPFIINQGGRQIVQLANSIIEKIEIIRDDDEV